MLKGFASDGSYGALSDSCKHCISEFGEKGGKDAGRAIWKHREMWAPELEKRERDEGSIDGTNCLQLRIRLPAITQTVEFAENSTLRVSMISLNTIGTWTFNSCECIPV